MPDSEVLIRPAERERDHDVLVKIAKKSKYISAFSSIMFSGEESYRKGWIRLAYEVDTGKVLGFTCVRHKVRSPETMLYFIMVDPEQEHNGVGQLLMLDLEVNSPHERIALKVEKENERAVEFYKKLGFQVMGDAYDGRGVLMHKDLNDHRKGRKR